METALDIHITGIVQGVGFRPFVYRCAKRNLIKGWVLNAVDGVHVRAQGEQALVDAFVLDLVNETPPSARITEVDLKDVPLEDLDGFEIRFSDEAAVKKTTLVSPDMAICADCTRELFDPADRRYRYPFINCTNCGPRFTIIEDLPYDRAATSMAEFTMCPECAAEYADPADRRFHAQPDACFACGPHISWWEPGASEGTEPVWGTTLEESDAIFARAVKVLLAGKILAVKGLGGFHLVCDGENAQAVAELRRRKRRDGKALAVMVPEVSVARRYCKVNAEEEAVLTGVARPIVLLQRRRDAQARPIPAGLADGMAELGVMLPYTPVQQLLLHDFAEAGGNMLVMTSGNVHDEPIQIDDAEAWVALAGIADAFLGNNRAIRARYDDSVVRVINAAGQPAIQMIRRARGFSPVPIALPTPGAAGEGDTSTMDAAPAAETPAVFAAGPEQKNTFCLTRGSEAFVSQHIGDLEDARTFDAWLETKDAFGKLFRVTPAVLAADAHPEYLSGKWAREEAAQAGLPLVEVQHHHAHVVSAMAEHGEAGPVCGIAFDGTGFGADGAIWGGEVLLSNLADYERFANMVYVPMPGGAAAVKNPLRMAYGVLSAFDLLDHPAAAEALAGLAEGTALLERMIDQGINTPHTSSVGRLFDAASALLGVCPHPTYEGEPAILLEAALWEGESKVAADAEGADEPFATYRPDPRYRLQLMKNSATPESTAHDTSVVLLDPAPTFSALLDDMAAGVSRALIAKRFHDAFVEAIVTIAQLVEGLYGIRTVALSGGVFMNRYLTEQVLAQLSEAGFKVLIGKDLPSNDGCIAYGQAVVAAQRLAAGE